LAQLLDFVVVMSGEFLDLCLMVGFSFSEMFADFLKAGLEFIRFLLVACFRLRKKFAVEIFDLGDPFWDESFQPTHRSWEQIGLIRFRSLQDRALSFTTSPLRCFIKQSSVKLDHFWRDASVN